MHLQMDSITLIWQTFLCLHAPALHPYDHLSSRWRLKLLALEKPMRLYLKTVVPGPNGGRGANGLSLLLKGSLIK